MREEDVIRSVAGEEWDRWVGIRYDFDRRHEAADVADALIAKLAAAVEERDRVITVLEDAIEARTPKEA